MIVTCNYSTKYNLHYNNKIMQMLTKLELHYCIKGTKLATGLSLAKVFDITVTNVVLS